MHGFSLTLPPRTAWVDLTRDLVAAGAARVGLPVDRFSDLLVLTERTAADFLDIVSQGEVIVTLTSEEGRIEIGFETPGVNPSPLTRLIMDRLADRSWRRADGGRTVTGFTFQR